MIKISRINKGTWQIKAFCEHDVEFITSALKLVMKVEKLNAVDSTKSASLVPLPVAELEPPLPVPEDQKPDSIWLSIRSPQSPVPLT